MKNTDCPAAQAQPPEARQAAAIRAKAAGAASGSLTRTRCARQEGNAK